MTVAICNLLVQLTGALAEQDHHSMVYFYVQNNQIDLGDPV